MIGSMWQELSSSLGRTSPVQSRERAVVAFGVVEVVILQASEGVQEALSDLASIDIFDWLPDAAGGLRMWEGKIEQIVHPATPDHATEYDLDFVGKWRELTEHEVLALWRGESIVGGVGG